ncbi:MAG: hypothetical protein ACREJ3_06125, partial [Polyangiaceae bacterium]
MSPSPTIAKLEALLARVVSRSAQPRDVHPREVEDTQGSEPATIPPPAPIAARAAAVRPLATPPRAQEVESSIDLDVAIGGSL